MGSDAAGRRVRRLAAVLLACLTWRQASASFGAPGIDFVQYWAVGKVRALTDGVLRDPYSQGPAMSVALQVWASREPDEPRLQAAARVRAKLELIQTPLLYAAFSLLPGRYERALALFHALQVVAFGLGFFQFFRLGGPKIPPGAVLLGLLLFAGAYYPVAADVQVGNLNLLQWGALAVLLRATLSVSDRRRAFGGHAAASALAWRAGAILAAGGALVLLKPNMILICGALVAWLASRLGLRTVARGAALALPVLVALVALPCAWIGRADVWWEWLAATGGASGLRDYSVEAGNYSLVVLMSRGAGIPVGVVMVAGAVLLAAMIVRFGRRGTGPDAPLTFVLATAGTLLLAPLVWLHYYVFVVPCAIALLPRGRVPAVLASAAVFLSSALGDGAWHALGMPGAVPYVVSSSALLLWLGGMAALPRPVLTEAAPAH